MSSKTERLTFETVVHIFSWVFSDLYYQDSEQSGWILDMTDPILQARQSFQN